LDRRYGNLRRSTMRWPSLRTDSAAANRGDHPSEDAGCSRRRRRCTRGT
jgi:hypothetical protein